jgi:class 3 adenylate cyclase
VDFVAVVDQVIILLRQRGRLTYRTLKRQFELDDTALEDLKEELIYGQRLAADEDERVLVWMDDTAATTPLASGRPTALDTIQARPPLAHTPSYLAEKILTSRSALEGERKHVAVLFADLKGSMELLADRDPEEARQLLDPVLERMMAAVHRYEGTVNQVMGDGIMALFGAPLAHEDHALRACYAALAMQAAVQRYATTHEVAYSSLLLERRRVLHTRVMEALEVLAGDRVAEQVERLAHHALRGEVWDKALVYFRQAGEKAIAQSSYREAVGYFEQALELTRVHQERGYQAYTLRLLGEIAARCSPPERELAEVHYQQALALAEEHGMRPLLAHCHCGLGTLYAATSRRQQAHTALSAAIALYRDMDMTFWLPAAEASLAQVQ